MQVGHAEGSAESGQMKHCLPAASTGSDSPVWQLLCSWAVRMQAHDAQRLLKDACTLAVQASPEDQSNWACLSQDLRADGEPYFDKCRHLRIADFSDTVSALPPEELQVPPPCFCPHCANVLPLCRRVMFYVVMSQNVPSCHKCVLLTR